MTDIRSHIQGLDYGKRVELLQIDLTRWGEGTLYWVSGTEGDLAGSVTFDGQLYTPWPFKADGFELTTDGPLPRPSIAVSDLQGILTPLVFANQNFRGAVVTRIRTFERFLDDGPEPDPDSVLPLEEYILVRKTKHKPGDVIQWEMAAALDVAGSMLPARQMVRDFCDLEYRVWDPLTETFTYFDGGCVYEGENYLTAADVTCGASEDVCGKRIGSCRARFGQNAELPAHFFPAISRVRVR